MRKALGSIPSVSMFTKLRPSDGALRKSAVSAGCHAPAEGRQSDPGAVTVFHLGNGKHNFQANKKRTKRLPSPPTTSKHTPCCGLWVDPVHDQHKEKSFEGFDALGDRGIHLARIELATFSVLG